MTQSCHNSLFQFFLEYVMTNVSPYNPQAVHPEVESLSAILGIRVQDPILTFTSDDVGEGNEILDPRTVTGMEAWSQINGKA